VTAAILTEHLTKRFGRDLALDDLDLRVEAGEVFGYLGPNGAGKSTTISLLLGFVAPTSGRAELLGTDVRHRATGAHGRVGYVPSSAELWPSLTAAETLRFLGRVHGSVDDAYRDELVRRFGLELDKKIRALSHGNRQKVLLIAAFAGRPDLLILDEPTTGLDPLMGQVFQECVREARDRGQTVFLSSHVLSEVDAVCDRVAMLRTGRLIEVGDLASLRGLAATRVEAELSGMLPDLRAVPGVAEVAVEGQDLRCTVSGPIGPLLEVLVPCGVRRLQTHEPSLEELFVARYGSDGTPPEAATP
jgi:ABC-2 type transport system ATP-binding protein